MPKLSRQEFLKGMDLARAGLMMEETAEFQIPNWHLAFGIWHLKFVMDVRAEALASGVS